MKKLILMSIIVMSAASLIAIGFNNQSNTQVKCKSKSEASIESNVEAGNLISGTRLFDDQFLRVVNSKAIPPIIYNVDTRYIHKITKSDLREAREVKEIFPEKVLDHIVEIKDTKLVLLDQEENQEIKGSGAKLTKQQIDLMRTFDYSTDFYLEVNAMNSSGYTDRIVYYTTVIPEKKAEYQAGSDELLKYLRTESTQATIGIHEGQLKPGQIAFTIDVEGNVSGVKLQSSSGHGPFDKRMQELIEELPDGWNPAKNEKGLPVEQKLILFFGIQGC
ncbi:energy transducer TonB [Portibacter marinus]|uniref:energy transducer TonB n=1 Tax=Portibacter marinus TaxID=2898660 RepID=UPI001F405069|nr:energy transducer TonB [Portibacter marinus]